MSTLDSEIRCENCRYWMIQFSTDVGNIGICSTQYNGKVTNENLTYDCQRCNKFTFK